MTMNSGHAAPGLQEDAAQSIHPYPASCFPDTGAAQGGWLTGD
jgi:hypothetical protein